MNENKRTKNVKVNKAIEQIENIDHNELLKASEKKGNKKSR